MLSQRQRCLMHGAQLDCQLCAPAYIVLPCKLTWNMVPFDSTRSWEFVVVALMCVATVTGKLASMRTSFVGLFAIGTLLYIDASNTFLSAQSIDYYDSDEHLHRIRTITAGAIMT